MFKTRSHWTRLALVGAIGALAVTASASAGSNNRGRTPSKPAKEVVRAEKAVQKMARQQENASRAAAKRAQPPKATRPSASGPSKGSSRSVSSGSTRTASSRGHGGGNHGHSSKSYGHSGSKHHNHSHYKPKSYSYTSYKPSFSIGIGYSSSGYGSVGYLGTSASYGYRSSCYPYYRPYYSSYCAPYGYLRPAYAYCPPSVSYTSYGYSSYPSSRYQIGSVDYFPAGGGVTTWESQATSSSADYYAWQRGVSLPDTPAISSVAPAPEPASPAVNPAPAGSGDLLADAWAALALGDASTAMGYFSTVADSAPELAQPKVGYALAAAGQGQIRPAAWSLRRAWSQNPDSIGYFPTGNGMIGRLDVIAEDLRRRAVAGEGTADLWFVLATVDYLRYQPEQAKESAERARILGDEHPSLAALNRRLEADVAGE